MKEQSRKRIRLPELLGASRVLSYGFILQLAFVSTRAFAVPGHHSQHILQQEGRQSLAGSAFLPTVSHSQHVRLPSFVRLAVKDKSADDDIPADWSEDEILAEFEGGGKAAATPTAPDTGDDDDEVVSFEDDGSVDDDDDDDDDVDIDDIDLDEEDADEEDAEMVSELVEEYEPSQTYNELEWDDEEDGGDYELEDDLDDPNYMQQKKIVEAAVESSETRTQDESFDPLEFIMNDMTEDQADIMDKLPFMKDIEAKARQMMLQDSDVEDIDLESAVADAPDFTREEYPRHRADEINFLEKTAGISDDVMEAYDNTYKKIRDTLDEEPWDKVMLKDMTGWENVPNTTLDEMGECLEELGGSAYNVTRWLLYDLDFNVSNLMMASIKHNPEAPVLFHHWYPQLVTYSRYSDVRARDFDFTWEDVQNADTEELERYYLGFGYDEIPSKAPSETGIIGFEDLDEEEIKMAAFENWMAEVYNPEWDRKDFDDEEMRDEDNVFSDYFVTPQHPDQPTFDDVEEDLENWQGDMGEDPESVEYRDRMGQSFKYDIVNDPEFKKEFRGHVVIACTGDDADIEVAEKITLRFEEEFGKQVWVETRVEALARDEDDVFEIWIESYEIDLLHSKKRANAANDWTGPAECDDAQIEYLVDEVRFLISDDSRYSYRVEYDIAD